MLFGHHITAPMSILIVTSGAHHGDVDNGVWVPGRKAKGIAQYRVIFVNSRSIFAGAARSPRSGPSSSFEKGALLRRPWPTLRPWDGEFLS